MGKIGLWDRIVNSTSKIISGDKEAYELFEKKENITDKNIKKVIRGYEKINPLYRDRKKWEKETEKSNQKILNKPVSKWSEQDRADIMRSKLYGTDEKAQRKVKEYYEHHNKGYQKYDATGRPY